MSDFRIIRPTLLNIGCGRKTDGLPAIFDGWNEIRIDLNRGAAPDLVASITDLAAIEASTADAIWSSHTLEHLEAHQVPVALSECLRVVRPGGFVLMTMPDLQQVARLVAEDRLDETVYESPVGPVAAIDMIFGHREAIARGQRLMAHRTGFTVTTLARALLAAGFAEVDVWTGPWALWAAAYPTPEAAARHRDSMAAV